MTSKAPKLTDRITFWLAVSLGALVSLALLVVPRAVFEAPAPAVTLLVLALLWPLMLGVLLSARVAVRLATGRPADLHLFGPVRLRGAAAVVVPLLLVVLMIALRERPPESAFALEANLFVSSSHQEIRWRDVENTGGPGATMNGLPADDPSWSGSAARWEVSVEDGPFGRAVVESLAGTPVPSGATTARVDVEAAAPFAWAPLWKHEVVPFTGTITLRIARGARRASWVGTFEGELRWEGRGFLAARAVGPRMGARLGDLVRQRIEEKLPAIEEKAGR
ncbi:MAG: hypothetical protein ACF8XB_03135 [Planctomycetota bacterium JB042]